MSSLSSIPQVCHKCSARFQVPGLAASVQGIDALTVGSNPIWVGRCGNRGGVCLGTTLPLRIRASPFAYFNECCLDGMPSFIGTPGFFLKHELEHNHCGLHFAFPPFPLSSNMKQSVFPTEAEGVPSRGWVQEGSWKWSTNCLLHVGDREKVPELGSLASLKITRNHSAWSRRKRCSFLEEPPRRQELFLRIKYQ